MIAVACATWCHCGICQSGEKRRSEYICTRWRSWSKPCYHFIVQRFSRAGPRGRGREWATQGVHPLSWLLSNNRLEEVCSTLTKGTFSSRLLLSNQDKGCTPSVAHSLPLPLGPALLNPSSNFMQMQLTVAGIVLSRPLFGIQVPLCTSARSFFSRHSGRCRCGIKRHMPLQSQVA